MQKKHLKYSISQALRKIAITYAIHVMSIAISSFDWKMPACLTTVSFLFQLNVSYPATGAQKVIEVDDERKL